MEEPIIHFFGPDGHCEEFRFSRSGRFYSDGSCYDGAIPGVARAGWAVVEVSESGHLVRGISGPVPDG
eukprot:4010960-Pyramimonas_sp.AAC.1